MCLLKFIHSWRREKREWIGPWEIVSAGQSGASLGKALVAQTWQPELCTQNPQQKKAALYLPRATVFHNIWSIAFYPGEATSFSTAAAAAANCYKWIVINHYLKEGLSAVSQGFLCLVMRRVKVLSFSFQLFPSHLTLPMSFIICFWFYSLSRATLICWPLHPPHLSVLLCVFVFVSHYEIVKLPLPLVDDLESFFLTFCLTFR